MTIYGILCGLTDFTNIADFMKLKEDYFTELLGLENGTPSHDCLSDIFARIDSKKFIEIFIEWIKEIIVNVNGKNISIDGKAIKSAIDKINGGNTPYIVSAFIGEIGLSIGQVKVDDKSNEITAIPELLDLLNIEGTTVTIDAIDTQEDIANKIVDKKGHYVLKVKKNQKELNRYVKRQFNKFNNLYGNDEVKVIDNYYIIDYPICINDLEKAIRDHWNIECGLHWRLDVIMNEDHSRNREKNSILNLATVRKIAFNLASLDNSFGKVPLQRKLTRYMLDFKNIEKLIFDVIPKLESCQ